jgi:hypothetical protein
MFHHPNADSMFPKFSLFPPSITKINTYFTLSPLPPTWIHDENTD